MDIPSIRHPITTTTTDPLPTSDTTWGGLGGGVSVSMPRTVCTAVVVQRRRYKILENIDNPMRWTVASELPTSHPLPVESDRR